MAQIIKVGIIGAGWPGVAHARGYRDAGGFKVVAVADLIPGRRKKVLEESGATIEFADADELLKNAEVDAVSICLPTFLHAPIALAALKAGKHVCCESPPALNAKEAAKLEAAAGKSGRTLLYSMQRRFGGAEQASRQAIAKGFAGEIYHARVSWMRTRGIPVGTGWYSDPARAGGGAMIDIGAHMLDLAWSLMGEPSPISVAAVSHAKIAAGVEDAAFALFRFEGNRSLELAASWAINQPATQQGTLCRLYGTTGFVDTYTNDGATIYRAFDAKGIAKTTMLKPPRVAGHAAMMRHFKACIAGEEKPMVGPAQGVQLMQMIDAFYKSAASGKSVEFK